MFESRDSRRALAAHRSLRSSTVHCTSFSTTLIPPSIHPTDIHSFHHYIILVFTLGVRLPATNRTRIPHDPPA